MRWFHEHLQPAGWRYVVLDEGWYLAHPENAGGKGDQGYTLDANGRYLPAPGRFPEGLAGLAKEAHGMGLKFGIHIIRGIPKEAVGRNLPLAGGGFHAAEAADKADVCQWNPDNYGVRDNAAGQAYYDGLMALYAGWGVDFLKVDCISAPYDTHEIHMIRRAIDKAGRPMVLSLSPGPTPLADAEDVAREANQWRISNDVWDVWSDAKAEAGGFPAPVRSQFERLAAWSAFRGPGHWPDADMLPLGMLGPRPGWGEARESRLTADEAQSLLSLWAVAQSPLILGANLTEMPPALEAALTNREWLRVDQEGSDGRQVMRDGELVVWTSRAGVGAGRYLAAFNLGETPREVTLPWEKLGVAPGPHGVEDIWSHAVQPAATEWRVTLRPHASGLVRVR